MSAQHTYRFVTSAQWSTCLFGRADEAWLQKENAVRSVPPFARPGVLQPSTGAHAPVVTPAGEILWADGNGELHRMLAVDDQSRTSPAPAAIASTRRIVATSKGLWVIGSANTLHCYDDESLSRLLTLDIPQGNAIDIAGDGHDELFVLVEDGGRWSVLRLDPCARIVETIPLRGISDAKAFVVVGSPRRFVVFIEDPNPARPDEPHQRLAWFNGEGGKSTLSISAGTLRPCFRAVALGSDARARILLVGADGNATAGEPHVLVLDVNGEPIDGVVLDPLHAPASGVAGTVDSMLVTGARGLLRFVNADVVPEGTGRVTCMVLTPMLYGPDQEDRRRWLRVDASARLDDASTIEIAIAATDDPETRDRINAMATDPSLSTSRRIATLLAEPDLWRAPTMYAGSDSTAAGDDTTVYSAKLFDVREKYLWACVTLSATAGGQLPVLAQLDVLYPGITLMERLPAIYQREEAQPNSFLRALVGVLEATTQEIDDRIASMGSHIDPNTAPAPWLDFVARWLGVPWDDGLREPQKRAILTRAAELARTRGTRRGLEALLDCVFPGIPRRFRVTDATADFGFAIVGGVACGGSALPAMLGGGARWTVELGSTAVLDHVRLPCPGQLDDATWQLTGVVRVEVAATAAERKTSASWIRDVIAEMIPLTATLQLRWVSAASLRTDRLGDQFVLTSAPEPHLGSDAVTDLARLPTRGARLSASTISTPLR
ncbi:MAG: phage tail protein [Gemmatimonadota bacterium]|nr:phage tail protein [Gemmatimonadota bacterium]